MSAYLLKERGYEVIGIHFVTGYESDDSRQIQSVADQIGIPLKIADCSTEFQIKVVDYFTQSYQSGKTPNPCLVCNPSIKFGTILDFARKLGVSCLATGHYARIIKHDSGRFHLYRGTDPVKEQSYFLAFLSQEQLASACFPLGNMTKSEVIKLAEKKGLHPVVKEESQDVCFIKGRTYGDFLVRTQGFEPEPGLIQDINGNIIGEHKGLHLFTIGQRRGINCPASEPYYVVRLDMAQNRLVVGLKKDLFSGECRVAGINWISRKPTDPIKVHTRVRYRHKAARSVLFPVDTHTAVIRFDEPQSAITPGQGAVFYKGDEVLGGGWIEKNVRC
ncbi:tRNA-specific 2-thiouridylase [Desulfonema magnum]|uniref:tRNA-specific 2-thiouridylase MnmA n=1 Tax=Desulfonema magnum TaxID=45655 RepID=A0A975GTL2_9BACT|nr:tRNA-specific 2-thiouridylase [Desulfonema magnum]